MQIPPNAIKTASLEIRRAKRCPLGANAKRTAVAQVSVIEMPVPLPIHSEVVREWETPHLQMELPIVAFGARMVPLLAVDSSTPSNRSFESSAARQTVGCGMFESI
ncbi:hypothetical protein ABU614_07095 [Lysobacter firmicutimachus]|uniref:Uncharacterized protein n=1 Tax=Lysobacter firmicutimachus TaxID=1792846 RepID=A0AAU8MY37_9GAMM